MQKRTLHIQEACAITRPLVLLMSKQDHIEELSPTMIKEVTHHLDDIDADLLPIILNGHFHLVVLNNHKQEYQHYLSC